MHVRFVFVLKKILLPFLLHTLHIKERIRTERQKNCQFEDLQIFAHRLATSYHHSFSLIQCRENPLNVRKKKRKKIAPKTEAAWITEILQCSFNDVELRPFLPDCDQITGLQVSFFLPKTYFLSLHAALLPDMHQVNSHSVIC